MKASPPGFFEMAEADVSRASDGSPMLIPRGLEKSGTRVPYTRASYMADFVEDKSHIHRWEMRYLAKAMGQNEDLAALAACETYSTGVSDATYGREKTASGRRLDEIVHRALDRVRIHEKADRGTAVHGFTEPGAPSGEAIPDRLQAAVASFWDINRRECIELVATEQFTANDTTMSAGTFDHLVRVPGHPLLTDYVIADKKTGNFAPFEWVVQLSSYANGEPYDTATDTRPAWPGPINKDYGLVWQIDAEQGATVLWVVNLALGWEIAQLAAKVRDVQQYKDLAVAFKSATFTQRYAASNTLEDLRRLWSSATSDDEREAVEQKVSLL